MLRALFFVLVLLVPCSAVAAHTLDEESDLIAEFKRFYSKDRSPQERLEAITVLKGIDRPAAARALLEALEDEDFVVRRRAIDVLSMHRQEETARLLMEEVLLERKLAKRTVLRGGAAEALGGMGHAFAYDALAALLTERDANLRLAGIAALGALGNAQACAALSVLAADPDGATAVAAINALVRINSAQGAEAAVVAALRHDDWRVRARAIGGVVSLRLKPGVRGLIELLRDEQGRLAGDAVQALKTVTLRDFGDNPQAWADWWNQTESRFEMPDHEKVRAARERAAREGTRYTTGKKQFLGLETRSENILFVIDVSGSMEIPFGDPDRLKAMGREYSSLKRLEIVKQELIFTIQELPDSTSFNILSFAKDVSAWKKLPARANVLNKNNATTWVQRLKPLGGQAAGFRAQTGLEINNADEGATNTHLALLTALGEDVKQSPGAGFVTDAAKSPLDTIFFLTDGEPTVGKTVDMTVIREEVRRVNEFRGVQIHVIFVGEFGFEDFEKLARENGGLFVAIGG
jgi:HEAT repeat protein